MEEDYIASAKPVIGEPAPAFHAVTTQGEMDFPRDFNGKWVIFFSLFTDFAPVCTTELMAFFAKTEEFREIDTELVGLSASSIYSHIEWLRRIKELSWKNIKHADISFPLVADPSMEISARYAMLHRSSSGVKTVRAVYIIDPEGCIRAMLYYPLSVGRNINEIKRMVMALQKADRERAELPADWVPGEDVILPSPRTAQAASERMEKVNENMYCLDWYLSFWQADSRIDIQEAQPEFNQYPSAYPMRRRNGYRR